MYLNLLLIILAVVPITLLHGEECEQSLAIDQIEKNQTFAWLDRITVDEGSLAASYPETYNKLLAMLHEVVDLPILLREKTYTVADFMQIYAQFKEATNGFSKRIAVMRDFHLRQFGGSNATKTLEQRILVKTLQQLSWMIAAHREPYCRILVKARDALNRISELAPEDELINCGNLSGMLKMPAQLLVSVVIGMRFKDFFTSSVPLHLLAKDLRDSLHVNQLNLQPGYLAFERLDIVIVDRETSKMSGIVIDTKGLWNELVGPAEISSPRLRALHRKSLFIHREFLSFKLPFAVNFFQISGLDEKSKKELEQNRVGWL